MPASSSSDDDGPRTRNKASRRPSVKKPIKRKAQDDSSDPDAGSSSSEEGEQQDKAPKRKNRPKKSLELALEDFEGLVLPILSVGANVWVEGKKDAKGKSKVEHSNYTSKPLDGWTISDVPLGTLDFQRFYPAILDRYNQDPNVHRWLKAQYEIGAEVGLYGWIKGASGWGVSSLASNELQDDTSLFEFYSKLQTRENPTVGVVFMNANPKKEAKNNAASQAFAQALNADDDEDDENPEKTEAELRQDQIAQTIAKLQKRYQPQPSISREAYYLPHPTSVEHHILLSHTLLRTWATSIVDEDVIPQTGKLVTEQNPPAHIEGFTARDWKRQVGKKTAVESLTLGELLGGRFNEVAPPSSSPIDDQTLGLTSEQLLTHFFRFARVPEHKMDSLRDACIDEDWIRPSQFSTVDAKDLKRDLNITSGLAEMVTTAAKNLGHFKRYLTIKLAEEAEEGVEAE